MPPIIHVNEPCVFHVLMPPIIHVNEPMFFPWVNVTYNARDVKVIIININNIKSLNSPFLHFHL